MTLPQLESHLWDAANILRGPVDAADFKSYVFPLLFFKLQSLKPGFPRVVPIEEIRAKEGNLSIPLNVGGETQARTDAVTETAVTLLPGALVAWLNSSRGLRESFHGFFTTTSSA